VGGFYLVTAAESIDRRTATMQALDRSFRQQGFEPAARIEWQDHVLQTFRKRGQAFGGEVYRDSRDTSNFVAACGTLAIEGRTGVDALRGLAANRNLDLASAAVLGSYCIVRNDDAGLRLQCDPLGLMQVFRNSSSSLWSSSFLALASATSERRFNEQAVYEYVFTEMPLGRDTVAAHIQLHDCRQIAHWQPALKLLPAFAPIPPVAPSRPPAALLDECVATLGTTFKSLHEAYPDRIDSGLSGGYDSRLILAALLKVGARPHLHVYGDSTSDDVQLAKTIAAAAGLDIRHIDKGRSPYPAPEEYRAKAIEWLHAFDGYSADGVMGNGQDIATRQHRVAGDRAALNGGGGEIFRNFFYLPDRSYTKRHLLWAFFSQFDAAVAQSRFTPQHYYERLEQKLDDCVGHTRSLLTRREIEWIYTAFRCRFWMGRNNCINSRLGSYFTPLMTWPLATLGLEIPLREKNHGRFESKLIRALAPQLAAITSSYGHDLTGAIPRSRILKDQLTLQRPVLARRWSFTLQARLAKATRPAWYSLATQAMDAKLPRMSQYFRIDKIKHAGQLNRLFTLELLGDQLDMQ